ALPVAVAALPAGRRLPASLSGRGRLVFALWEGVLLLGVGAAWTAGRRMPYLSQFFGSGGLGPSDVLGSRPHFFDLGALGWLTVVCVGASLLLALLAARGTSAPPPSRRAKAGLVLAIGLGQVVGVLPPSFHYIGWTAGSLDRYLLPLLPFAVALLLWAARGLRLALPLGWLAIALLAAFSIAGTRDYLVFMDAVWNMARTANAAGVANDRLDAGSAWDGYHLYEESLAGHIKPRALTKGPWWVYFYAPATDSSYVVATKPQPGYVVAMSRPYSAWLARGPTRLYLLRRLWMPWPARSASPASPTSPVRPRWPGWPR
ncbi:MAG TPA: hypothetical protein VFQ80_07020, partial [Thermomicrobiales bacterium]|nr:hypothetical protein [Thermomicrobiales bacterium]